MTESPLKGTRDSIPPYVHRIIQEYARAKALYAEAWLSKYSEGLKMKACEMEVDALPVGITYHIIKQQLDYLKRNAHDDIEEAL